MFYVLTEIVKRNMKQEDFLIMDLFRDHSLAFVATYKGCEMIVTHVFNNQFES